MKNKIKILDLFSGIGGFSKGFKEAGYNITKHYFSEIDKHAISVYKYNFKDAIYAGSVEHIQSGDIEQPDVITFGSPCQDFSLAGKRKGMGGQRSSLVLEAIRLISELRPSVFIWENVKGAFSSNNGADFWAILQAFANIGGYRLEWQLLNTVWFLPQNRERIYLVGHLDGRSEPGVFPIGEEINMAEQRATEMQIASCLAGSGGHISNGEYKGMNLVKVKSATSQGFELAKERDSINLSNPNSETRRGRVGKGVAQTLDCACNQAVIGAFRGRNTDNPSIRKSGLPTEQMLEINKNGCSNTLTSVHKDNVVVGTWRTHKDGQGFRQVSGNNSPTIPARAREDGSGQPVIQEGINIRRLTEIECERLQGFPDNWTEYGDYDGVIKKVPKTQRYKMCGNAVTVNVVKAVAERLKII